jgi:ATP-binding cassette subfamily B protein
MSLIPLRLLIRWLQGVLSVRVGSVLKQKLCHGALQLDPDDLRHQGVGGLLAKVLESEQLETLSINGGFVGLLAVVEFVMAAFVLSLGLGNGILLLALFLWLVVTVLLGWTYYKRCRTWSAKRLLMTHHLVERMIGHRTRRLQQPPSLWHEEEDQELSKYIHASKRMDALSALMVAAIPRGWIVLALFFLAPLLIHSVFTAASVAVTVGGMLLAFRAFQKLVLSVNNLAGAAIAWYYIAELVHASDQMQDDGAVDLFSNFSNDQTSDTVLSLRHINFQYLSRGQNVLSQANLDIQKGDRILLQGPSGGGKSTLVSLLSALRKPTSGLMFLKGLDLTTWGSRLWRKHVAAAPQFHENRVLSATFAFNLLMGRDWPPTPDDLREAENICNELGLDKLLREMPAGMMQMVGETGWQLSHGEKSRLYVARALLQKAPLVILDESFAALDSQTIAKVHETINRRADSLIVVAHP